MKKQNSFLVMILLIATGIFFSCSEESMQGPMGVKGPQGDIGDKGTKGEAGEGISKVLKYSFTIDKGTTAWNTGSWIDAQGEVRSGGWAAAVTGAKNGGVVHVITEDHFGGIPLNTEEYLVIAYARPEGTVQYSQKKMLPYIFTVDGTKGFKIEILTNRGAYGNIMMSRSEKGWDNLGSAFGIGTVPQYVHLDVFFIEVRRVDEEEEENPAAAIDINNYEVLNNYYYRNIE